MAITIASANAALVRNGLAAYTLEKNADGHIVLLCDNGPHAPKSSIPTGATRVRDLSITEVVGLAGKDRRQQAEVFAAPVVPEGEPEVTPADKVNFFSATGNVDAIPNDGRRYAVVLVDDGKELEQLYPNKIDAENIINPAALDDWLKKVAKESGGEIRDGKLHAPFPQSSPIGSHVQRRAQESFGDARRALPRKGDSDPKRAARDSMRDHNEAYVAANLSDRLPEGVQVRVMRSGDLLFFRTGGDSHVVKLRTLGLRGMRDRPVSWWMAVAPRLADGLPAVAPGDERLSADRVRELAGQLQAYRIAMRRKLEAGGFAWLVLHADGKTTVQSGPNLRPAFAMMNSGERVFINNTDLHRYTVELKNGKHGPFAGASDF